MTTAITAEMHSVNLQRSCLSKHESPRLDIYVCCLSVGQLEIMKDKIKINKIDELLFEDQIILSDAMESDIPIKEWWQKCIFSTSYVAV